MDEEARERVEKAAPGPTGEEVEGASCYTCGRAIGNDHTLTCPRRAWGVVVDHGQERFDWRPPSTIPPRPPVPSMRSRVDDALACLRQGDPGAAQRWLEEAIDPQATRGALVAPAELLEVAQQLEGWDPAARTAAAARLREMAERDPSGAAEVVGAFRDRADEAYEKLLAGDRDAALDILRMMRGVVAQKATRDELRQIATDAREMAGSEAAKRSRVEQQLALARDAGSRILEVARAALGAVGQIEMPEEFEEWQAALETWEGVFRDIERREPGTGEQAVEPELAECAARVAGWRFEDETPTRLALAVHRAADELAIDPEQVEVVVRRRA